MATVRSEELGERLRRLPSLRPSALPTPLEHAGGLSKLLGRDIWLKRDDLAGVAMGGNKTRKLAFLAADALQSGADTLVSVGAHQSNHARTVAAYASLLGMECYLVLGGEAEDPLTGNILLSKILGARQTFCNTDDWDELGRHASELVEQLKKENRRPYLIPIGGSVPQGVAGFVGAYLELREQCRQAGFSPTVVFHATSTGGTQAGLELARAFLQDSTQIIGVGVAKTSADLATSVRGLISKTAAFLQLPDLDDQVRVNVLDGYAGDGYALSTVQGRRWLEILARSDGVLTDPTYTAKALAALPEVLELTGNGSVVFWHTGGLPALFQRDGIDPKLKTNNKEQQNA